LYEKVLAEREFNSIPKIGLSSLRNYFLRICNQLYKDDFFEKAETVWANDPDFFIFRKLGLWDIWPIEENIAKYDEATYFLLLNSFMIMFIGNTLQVYLNFRLGELCMDMIKSMVKEYIGLW
jgi:hypothetical protein